MIDDVRAALALAIEHGLAFNALRDFRPDRRLFHYLPRDLAEAEGVVPVVLISDTLTVASASARPDLSVLERRFPRLRVEVIVAPRAAIDAALDHGAEGAP